MSRLLPAMTSAVLLLSLAACGNDSPAVPRLQGDQASTYVASALAFASPQGPKQAAWCTAHKTEQAMRTAVTDFTTDYRRQTGADIRNEDVHNAMTAFCGRTTR